MSFKKTISTTYSVFHRHGHRAASKDLFATDKIDWSHLVCYPHDTEHLNDKFPIVNFNSATEDNATFPFGALTKHGASHMINIGKNLALKFPAMKMLSDNINVYSTNYRRTQISAQFLLEGLGVNFSSSSLISPVEELSSPEDCSDSSTPVTIPVTVHDVKTCPITFYERFPALSTVLVRKVQASARFQLQEDSSLVVSAKGILARAFPILDKGRYGFNWPAVHDYFICRRAHNLSVLPELRHLESMVDHHYIFRYSMYFRDPEHLTLFTLPILRRVMGDIQRAAYASSLSSSSSSVQQDSVVENLSSTLALYSSHDITLYGLLHVLGAEQAVRNWEIVESEWQRVRNDKQLYLSPSSQQMDLASLSPAGYQMTPLYWPYYGSNLVFEAQVESSVAANVNSGGAIEGVDCSELDNTRVQVFLDMMPVNFNLEYIDRLIAEHDALEVDDSCVEPVARCDSDHFTVHQLRVLINKLTKIEQQMFSKYGV